MLPFEDTSIPPPKTSPQKRRKVDSDPPKAEISNAKKIEQKEMFRTGQEKGKEKGDKDTLVKGEESQSAFPDHYCANCVEVICDCFLVYHLLSFSSGSHLNAFS